MSEKNSFILYTDQKATIDKLTDEQAGQLIKAIYAHEVGEDYKLEGMLDIIITPFIVALDKNSEKYQKRAKSNKENVAKRWNKDNTKNTNGINGIPTDTKNTNGNDNDNDIVNDNDTVIIHNDNKSDEDEEKSEPMGWEEAYEENIGEVSPIIVHEINRYELADEVVEEAIKEAVFHNALSLSYILAVLQDYKKSNIKCRQDVEDRRKNHVKNRPKKEDKQPSSAFYDEIQMANEYQNLERYYCNLQ